MSVSSLLDASVARSGSAPTQERRACQVRLSQREDSWSFEYIPLLTIPGTCRAREINIPLPVKVGQCNVPNKASRALTLQPMTLACPYPPPHSSTKSLMPGGARTLAPYLGVLQEAFPIAIAIPPQNPHCPMTETITLCEP